MFIYVKILYFSNIEGRYLILKRQRMKKNEKVLINPNQSEKARQQIM